MRMRVLSQVISASVSATGLLTGTSTQTSATGLILQPLRSLSMFTQTANWWHQLAMLTSSRCLLGTMKMFVAAGWTGPGPRRRGAEAQSRSFRREARGASMIFAQLYCAPLLPSQRYTYIFPRPPPHPALPRTPAPIVGAVQEQIDGACRSVLGSRASTLSLLPIVRTDFSRATFVPT